MTVLTSLFVQSSSKEKEYKTVTNETVVDDRIPVLLFTCMTWSYFPQSVDSSSGLGLTISFNHRLSALTMTSIDSTTQSDFSIGSPPSSFNENKVIFT